MPISYPNRLIEVDLPIKRISAHARREKSIRHGHISTLHIWWARRPLAACRAVICAALWPDPADPICPKTFRKKALAEMLAWTSHERQKLLSAESCIRFEAARQNPQKFDDAKELRGALLDFIADFANWDNSTVREYLDTSRALTQAAHEALGGAPGTRPLVVDPFCGGGSIPLEALRVGADAFASDLNPIPVLLNKVVLEYIPKYGQRLADEVRKWGEWIKREAEKELAQFYPKDADGATPIAYLWARTIQCEGPGCGAEVPLIRSLWLAKKPHRSVGLQLVPNKKAKRVDFQIIVKHRDGWVDQANLKTKIENPKFDGTVKRGSATCPSCGYTTPVARVREQLKARHGGANDARLMCIVTTSASEQGRSYRKPTDADLKHVREATAKLEQRKQAHKGPVSLVPDEKLDLRGIRHTWGMIYGMESWGDFFTPRQSLALTTILRLVQDAADQSAKANRAEFGVALQTCLVLAVSRLTDRTSSLCTWRPQADQEKVEHAFARQAIPMTWDFAEGTFLSERTAGWKDAYEPPAKLIEEFGVLSLAPGTVTRSSATSHPLPDDSAHLFVTDPPYYDAVPYAFLADYFYVWLRRGLATIHTEMKDLAAVPKDEEIVVDRPHELSNSTHNIAFYERELTKAFAEGRRVLRPDGVGTIVFASKTTASWEAILKAVVDAGWIITGSWPIDTEMENRVSAQGQARLASSVHLVCRPRENPDGSVRTDEIGDWRDVLQELPRRIHEWMPRLAEEGVVGADAIFACLGPALEIFSRYSRVEKASGETVTLKEYLESVWAAVAKEALTIIFPDADTIGFEEDARLTAMWLWTLNAGHTDAANGESAEDEDVEDDSEAGAKKAKTTGFVLEYDAARKIAQGLGAHLEDLGSVVEISGETARLLPVGERARHLFGKDEGKITPQRRKREPQMDLFKVLQQADEGGTTFGEPKVERQGATVLDRIHQSMILFAAGRGEALKRFLVEDGAGRDQRFWQLAQALSALYPSQTEEKRWVDGVLARKKGLGF
jgi:adenine-specific DNA methylase